MKHPQYIFAFLKEAFGPLEPGITRMELKDLAIRAEGSLFVGRRHELESNENFGQVLPYITIKNASGIFVYQRTKLVGEERLAGKCSVGIGGHVDAADAGFSAPSVLSFTQTMANACSRELEEELIVKNAAGEEIAYGDMVRKHDIVSAIPQVVGMINDTSDEVGRVHYGILMAATVPDEFTVFCREGELKTLGFMKQENMGEFAFENWSRLVLEFIANELH